jgi:AraC-like DNA-binding protein
MKYVLKKLNDELKVTGIANLHFFEFPENYYTENDSHPFMELVFVSSGRLAINSDNFNGILEKHRLLIHKADEVHSLKTVEDNTPTVIIIGFTCEGGEIDRFSSSPTALDDQDVKKLAEIVKEGRNVFAPPYDVPKYDMKKKKNPPYGSEQMLKNLLEYFLISLSRKYGDKNLTEESTVTDKVNAAEIISYIDDNYKEKITLDELAFIFRTNRSTLCKVFKATTGKTISEYVNDKKLLKAKDKILSTDKTLTEIAEELNFESIHYFTRFFKKHVGVSPKEFRKNEK